MDTQKTYIAQNNPPLTQVSAVLGKIIAQELDFRKQLTTFQIMLQSADVLKSPISRTQDAPRQQPVAVPISQNQTGHSLLKRSILDIFTPYSLNTVGDTANDNYRIMNRNFHDVHDTELKLSHQQTVLYENLGELTSQQLDVAQKELYLELRSLKTRYFQDFLFSLEQILQNNRLDSAYEIIFELLRTHQFCNSDTCLTAPIFTVISDSKIQITVQKALQSLAKAVFISCTVLQNDRTSVYSHQIALVDGPNLHFQEDQLPSIRATDLVHPSIDKMTRPISETDLLDGIFYPVYADNKVSLQCLEAKFVTINNKERHCDSTSLVVGSGTQEAVTSAIPPPELRSAALSSAGLATCSASFFSSSSS